MDSGFINVSSPGAVPCSSCVATKQKHGGPRARSAPHMLSDGFSLGIAVGVNNHLMHTPQEIKNIVGEGVSASASEFHPPGVYMSLLIRFKELPYVATPQPTEIKHGVIWFHNVKIPTYDDGVAWHLPPLRENIKLQNTQMSLEHCTSTDSTLQRRTYTIKSTGLTCVHYLSKDIVSSRVLSSFTATPAASDEVSPDADITDVDSNLYLTGPVQSGRPEISVFPKTVDVGDDLLVLLPPSLAGYLKLSITVKVGGVPVKHKPIEQNSALSVAVPVLRVTRQPPVLTVEYNGIFLTEPCEIILRESTAMDFKSGLVSLLQSMRERLGDEPPLSDHSNASTPRRASGLHQPTDTTDQDEQIPFKKFVFSVISAMSESRVPAGESAMLFAPDSEGITLTHYLAYLGLVGPLDILLTYAPPHCVNALDARGMTPLHYAVMKDRNEPVVAVLLNFGATPDVQDMSGNTPMSIAADLSNTAGRLLAKDETPPSQTNSIDISLEDELLSQLSFFTGSTDLENGDGEEWEALEALHSITNNPQSPAGSSDMSDQDPDQTALIIQRNVRKWSAQRQYHLVRRSIETLQAAVRGRMARKEIDKLKKVLTIQRSVRQWLRKRGLSPTKQDCQRNSKSRKSRDLENEVKRQMDAVSTIQRSVRDWLQKGRSVTPPVVQTPGACLGDLTTQLAEKQRQVTQLTARLEHEELRQQFRSKLDDNLDKVMEIQRHARNCKNRDELENMQSISSHLSKILVIQRATRAWLAKEK
eukprot:TRINITY_DN3518_c4_g1_i1.p1 TRINITY_DN3518_c4_g1~~TRINITY_DN3518_c4_g1_i1.p1  ORF type:complete len:757 (+),score=139.25 TRINITY_DN3518_c4_g1_i1:61-2331(+)